MNHGLVVERQPADNEFNRILYLLKVNYIEDSMHIDDVTTLPQRIVEAYSLYLDMVCSKIIGGANMEWIVGEYLHGQCLKPENKGLIEENIKYCFERAAQPAVGFLNVLTQQIIEQGEEISEVRYYTNPTTKAAMILLESELWE